ARASRPARSRRAPRTSPAASASETLLRARQRAQARQRLRRPGASTPLIVRNRLCLYPDAMDRELEITPEPSPAERAAIAAALASVLAGPAVPVAGTWLETCCATTLDADVPASPVWQPRQATARRPRRRFGATRA